MNIGIIGCGHIFQTMYVPALTSCKDINIEWLVDTNSVNLEKVSRIYPSARKADTIEKIGNIEAVIVATPNFLHYSQGKFALKKGWHVLVEKPLATIYEEGEDLVKESRRLNLICCVNLNRRFLPNITLLKEIIRKMYFGKVKRIKVIDGARCIGAAGGGLHYLSSLKMSGGGVFLDTGSHMLDLPLYLVSASNCKNINYYDDGFTGIEAECRFTLEADTAQGAVTIEGFLSRISPSPQSITIEFEKAVISTALNPLSDLNVTLPDKPGLTFKLPVPIAYNPISVSFSESLNDFFNACRHIKNAAPVNSAADFLVTLKTIENCYKQRKAVPVKNDSSNGKIKVGIIGAGGFLGSRLFETLLCSKKYFPKAITHSSLGSFSILRYTDALEIGDASDVRFLKKALVGCDIVVNCAINTKGTRKFAIASTRGITKGIATACSQLGIKKMVHISSIGIHGIFLGRRPDKLVLDPARSTYSVVKYLSEKDALNICGRNGVGCVVLRMGNIYGPHGVWTAFQREMVKSGKLVSVDKWKNPSNTVFIDNAVSAIIAAMENSNADQHTFYITDWPNRTWADFYSPLFKLEQTNMGNVRDMDYEEFKAILGKFRKNLFSQFLNLSLEMLKYPMGKEHLLSIKTNPGYRRLFEIAEGILPSAFFDKIKEAVKNKNSSLYNKKVTNAAVFDLLCCYASNVELPIRDSLEGLGYSPVVRKDAADKLTAEWLKYIELK